jgi:hypothetical protein
VWTDELTTNQFADLMTDTYELTNRSVHSMAKKDELTTDQFNLYSSKKRPYKQIRSASTKGQKISLLTDRLNLY